MPNSVRRNSYSDNSLEKGLMLLKKSKLLYKAVVNTVIIKSNNARYIN